MNGFTNDLKQAHLICAQRIREALNGDDPQIALSARDRKQLAESMAAHEAEARK